MSDNRLQELKRAWAESGYALETEVALIGALVQDGALEDAYLMTAVACGYKPAVTYWEQYTTKDEAEPRQVERLDWKDFPLTLASHEEYWEVHALVQLGIVLLAPGDPDESYGKTLRAIQDAALLPLPKKVSKAHALYKKQPEKEAGNFHANLDFLVRIALAALNEQEFDIRDYAPRFYLSILQSIDPTLNTQEGAVYQLTEINPFPLVEAWNAFHNAIYSIFPAMLGYGELPKFES